MFTLPSLRQKSRPSIFPPNQKPGLSRSIIASEGSESIHSLKLTQRAPKIGHLKRKWITCPSIVIFRGYVCSFFFGSTVRDLPFATGSFIFARSSLWLIGGFNLFEKYYIVKMGSSSPSRGESKKYLSCHHLDDLCTRCFRKLRCLNLHGAFGFAALLLSKPWPNIKHHISDSSYSSWWFQPICNILVKNGNLPQVSAGVKIKDICNHHLEITWYFQVIPRDLSLQLRTSTDPEFLANNERSGKCEFRTLNSQPQRLRRGKQSEQWMIGKHA